jgi:hypothetical protein
MHKQSPWLSLLLIRFFDRNFCGLVDLGGRWYSWYFLKQAQGSP